MFKFQFLLSTFQNLLLNGVLTYKTEYLHFSVGREREREKEEKKRERDMRGRDNHRHRKRISCGKGANACVIG